MGGAPLLDLSSFERLELIDETPMSAVFRLRDRRSGAFAAGKRIRRGSEVHRSGDCLNEVRMLSKFAKIPQVVNLLGVCDTGAEFWTVLELCGGGRLEFWLERNPRTTSSVVRDLLDGILALHSLRVCHLDIKPDNVLLTREGSVRLCDFVTACQLEEVGQLVLGSCGTEGFKAPEVGGSTGYCGLRADLFSLGRTLQAAAAKVEPTWRELIRACRQLIADDPKQRPTLASVRASMFGTAAVDDGETPAVVLDLASLDTVGCREASASSFARSNGGGGRSSLQSGAAVRAQAPEASVAHPPAQGPRRASAGGGGGGGGGGGAGRRQVPAAAPQRSRAPSGPAKPPPCGSITCMRIGTCLCNDIPPPTSIRPCDRPENKNALRRCNTP